MKTKTMRNMALFAIFVVLAALLPWIGSPTLVEFGFNALIIAILAQGWNTIGGYTGYASFGNVTFFGLGAYGVGIMMVQWEHSFIAGLLFGLVLAVMFAYLIGLPILRLKGHYFAIATLALSQMVAAVITNIDVAGGNQGIPFVEFLDMSWIDSDAAFYLMALLLLVLTTTVIWGLTNSKFGFGLIAIRENEDGAAAMGVNTTWYKVNAFAVSAAFSALAGGIYAYKMTYIDPEQVFAAHWNVQMIIMAVFGGAGTVFGPIFGAVTLGGIAEFLASEYTHIAGLFYGVVIILAVMLTPHGLIRMFTGVYRQGVRYFINNVRATKL